MTRDLLSSVKENKKLQYFNSRRHCQTTMYNICITKTMDQFNNNGLAYPMNPFPAPGRDKTQVQFYNNVPSNAAHRITPIPCYRPTQPPEQVPLDWNIPVLPELSASYSAPPQSFVQDLNSMLPSYGARVYQNVTRASQGEDTLCFKNVSGGFLSLPHLLIHLLAKEITLFMILSLAHSSPFRGIQLLHLSIYYTKILQTK